MRVYIYIYIYLLGSAIVEAAIAWADGITKKLLMFCHVLSENASLAVENINQFSIPLLR